MDTKGNSDRIIALKARLYEIGREKKIVESELFIAIGKAQAYAEVEAKIKQELEAQKAQATP